jgi:hypothetical protein
VEICRSKAQAVVVHGLIVEVLEGGVEILHKSFPSSKPRPIAAAIAVGGGVPIIEIQL